MKKMLFAATAAVLSASGAQAITVDGTIGFGEYAGALVTTVQRGANVDSGAQGPGTPGVFVENVGYTVYYSSDATNVYVGLRSDVASGLPFANLYFDTNNATAAGSDIGFEVFNNKAFVPATGVFSATSLTSVGAVYASTPGAGAVGDVIEFSIPWTVFVTNALGLNQPLVAAGGLLQLRTSQSFNYAGATGDGGTGDVISRFGFQAAPLADAVPEPGTWAMLVLGFGLVGGAARRRKAAVAAA